MIKRKLGVLLFIFVLLVSSMGVYAIQRIGGIFEEEGYGREVSAGPNIIAISEKVNGKVPSASSPVYITGNSIPLEIVLDNTGTSMTETWIIEAQPKKIGERSGAAIFGQATCDPTAPQNVHIQFQMSAEDPQATLRFNIPILGGDGTYEIVLLSVASCCSSSRGCTESLGPYGWGNIKILSPILSSETG